MAAPPVGYVLISSKDPPVSVRARLWEDRPNVSGYGGWEEVERPRRKPITFWKTQPGLKLELSLLLDDWRRGRSVERQIALVEKLALPTATDGEPPQLKITAAGGMIPYQSVTWVVADLAWGDGLANEQGDRVRQQFTLALLQHVEDVYLADRSAANRRKKRKARAKTKRGAAKKRVVAKRSTRKRRTGALRTGSVTDEFGQGEDLLAIAARELGDASRWPEIAELNGIRDPRSITPGQVLRLP